MEDARAHAPNSRRYRLAAMLRGGSRPLNLALALVLGLAIGLTVGWNFTVFALLLLAALANVNSKLLAISTTAGALLAWLAGPVLAGIGGFIFDETPLGNWIGMLGD